MFVLASVLAFLSLASATQWQELDNYTFEKYVEEFNLNLSPKEITTRKAIFNQELARIKAHNSKNLSWKEGVSKFTIMTEQEKKAYRGQAKNKGKKLLEGAKPLPADFKIRPVSELPANVDWRDADIVSAVKDQGQCGSCWAFSSTAVLESHVAKASGLLFDLSVQQMAMCAPNPNHCGGTGGCAGATFDVAYTYGSSVKGFYQEYQYAYNSYYGQDYNCSTPKTGRPVASMNGYVKLESNNYEQLMNAVATVGPVAITVDASAWSSYESGIFDGCNQVNPDLDHGVVLVGYGVDNGQNYWLVRNSWSPAWGEKGYIRLARTVDEQSRCGLDKTPQDGTACEGDNTPVTACGTCGILYDSAYPLNAKAL